jgi:putative nucleotidyltransferase with HDIG domain
MEACPDCGNRLDLAADGGERGVIRTHCIAQEYWYIRRQQCECGGRYESLMHARMVGCVSRHSVRCKCCGGTTEYDFDTSTYDVASFMEGMLKWSNVIGNAEAGRAFGPPMELASKLVSELADNGDELALDYLADVIAHARETATDQELPHVSQPLGTDASVSAALAWAIDAVIQHNCGHTQRVRQIARLIGIEMERDQDEVQALETVAVLHDIGKLAVPDYILSKPDQLTQEEMKKVRTHTLAGAAILEPVQFPWPVIPAVRSHHEWWDGSGYPDGLAGDQIPLAARILTVADIYDALLSHRPYRPAMTVQDAVDFMRQRAGTQFDPTVLDTWFRVLASQQGNDQFRFIFDANALNEPTQGREGEKV